MNNFTIAAAQITSISGDVAANIALHAKAIKAAARQQVNVLVFPELSLTGYEPALAAELVFRVDDERLKPLAILAQEYGITVIAGGPLFSDKARPYIAALIFSSDGGFSTYSKIHLHPGEEEFFLAGHASRIIKFATRSIGIAICADTTHPSHPEVYSRLGAGIYAAGVLITESGYAADAALLEGYAREHNMLVVLANYNAPTGGYIPAGKSAIWAPRGQLIALAGQSEDALVIATSNGVRWQGSVTGI